MKNKQASQRAKGEGRRIRRARNIVKRWESGTSGVNVSFDAVSEIQREVCRKRYDKAVALLAYYHLASS